MKTPNTFLETSANLARGSTSFQSTNKSGVKIWNRVAKRYAAKPIADLDAYSHKITTTRKYFNTDSRVLELGCGTGKTAIKHAPYVQHIRAIDYSSNMLEIARLDAKEKAISNVDFERNDLGSELNRTQTFDVVLALGLLHLVEDWGRAILSIYYQCKPGGVFITSTPCLQEIAPFLRFITPILSTVGIAPKLSLFNQAELEAALINAGFQIESTWQPSRKAAVFIVARRPL